MHAKHAVDKPHRHCTEQKKPDIKQYMMNYSMYMEFKNKQN